MEMGVEERLKSHLEFLYGEKQGQQVWPLLQKRLADFGQRNPELQEDVGGPMERLSERDAILITYGDQFQVSDCPPLQSLNDFMEQHLFGAINGVHILPFFPYSSDDGFAVIDYRQVNPELGTWEDIARLDESFRLMFDAVINHISRESEWFQAFLRGRAPYRDYFITLDPDTDLSMVVRPRALPLLTPVETDHGRQYVWTTFSDDQIDLNYANPQVLLEIVDLLLFYVEQGAEIIRLDAIAYLWKKAGTPSIHLPETHHVVKLFRAVLDTVAPEVILITETNVPHAENISYFGDSLRETGDGSPKRGDEAQMVYQFPLAPLVLHTFHTGDARVLTDWAASLEIPYPTASFFNFIASHDGIGVRPAEGLLTPNEIQTLVDKTEAHGGQVSYKTNKDGSKSVYELNITLYDALNNPNDPDLEVDVQRFLASQVIMLSLAGVPGIYVHSLFGSRNCYQCLEESGRTRSINREKFQQAELEKKLEDPDSREALVFAGYTHLLRRRREHPAFHPNGGQKVPDLGKACFGVIRSSPKGDETALCIVNVSAQRQRLSLRIDQLGLPEAEQWRDLIKGGVYLVENGQLRLNLRGYQALWLV
jgi:glycosidase